MRTKRLKDWASFKKWAMDFSALDYESRRQFLFRGHSDASWELKPTLDRVLKFRDDEHRNRYYEELIQHFDREAIGLGIRVGIKPDRGSFDLLARHHGLPSPILDWSESPYIAAFFAFEAGEGRASDSVAIWVLDRAGLPLEDAEIELIHDAELIRTNPRALRQRGVFLRVSTMASPVDRILDAALMKLLLPRSTRGIALADLDEMQINAVSLFGDLDAAARTAAYRASLLAAPD